jgi:hypothetical protein
MASVLFISLKKKEKFQEQFFRGCSQYKEWIIR